MKTFKFRHCEIDPIDREGLRNEVLTRNKPIGSTFLELYGNQNRQLFQYLFDGHSQYLYEQLNERPSIIVGRKGSGKSTYLNNLSFKKSVVAISINQWKVMDEVQQIISALIDKGYEIRAERASYIWQWIFLSAVAAKTFTIISRNSSLREFAEFFPLEEFSKIGISAITSFVKNTITKFLGENSDQVELASITWILEDKSEAIDSLEKSISDELSKYDKVSIVLFDNEEDVLHQTDILKETNLQGAKELAIAGLLNLCGRMNEGAVNVQIRYCIPAEQFFAFKNLSKTTGKDFSNLHLLHWSVGELLSMIAHRYMLHIYVWKDVIPELNELYISLIDIPIYTRDGALKFFSTVLPREISNGRELPEAALTYLLRHFQILPRQLISLFNTILSLTIKMEGDLGNIRADVLIDAVHNEEASMADEIIKAYEMMYPEACLVRKKVLPNLPLYFPYNELRRYYDGKEFVNRGKDILSSMKSLVTVSPDRFERCLIETGMLGRVISLPAVNKPGYINAEFEYSLPGSLDLCEDDSLVLHPIFSGQKLKLAKKQFAEHIIGVYPHDADPHEDQNRDFLKNQFVSKVYGW